MNASILKESHEHQTDPGRAACRWRSNRENHPRPAIGRASGSALAGGRGPAVSGRTVITGDAGGSGSAQQMWEALRHARVEQKPRTLAHLEDALFRHYLPMARSMARSYAPDAAEPAPVLHRASPQAAWWWPIPHLGADDDPPRMVSPHRRRRRAAAMGAGG